MKYEITKEQILILKNGYRTEKLLEWFPEAFKTVLEVGKWYKTKFVLINITNIDAKGKVYGYGWDLCSEIWHDSDNDDWGVENATEATESEVFEALKNEAVKRGYCKENTFVKSIITKKREFNLSKSGYIDDGYEYTFNKQLIFNGVSIFKDGQWAEIIPTITKSEAEKLLNKKII